MADIRLLRVHGNAVRPLSSAARGVWAKSQTDEATRREVIGWLPLHQHLDDSGSVAGRLWDEWVSDAVKRIVSRPFHGNGVLARTLYVWLAGVHDIGKASVAFAVQVPSLADDMTRLGLVVDPSLHGTEERRAARHELVSYVTVQSWLVGQHGFTLSRAAQYASILAAHHGLPPDDLQLRNGRQARLFGNGLWGSVRDEFLMRAEQLHLTGDDLAALRDTELPQPVQVLLSGLVIVADWIASDEKLFAYVPRGEQPRESTQFRLDAAWERLALPSPWHPEAPPEDTGALFAKRFQLPPDAAVRPVQGHLVDVARKVAEPSLIILEAEMGVGKTEAAFAAAEVLAARFGLGGVFIGLPTQATTDGMYSRMASWAKRLGIGDANNIFLARAKSQLNEEYGDLPRHTYRRGVGDDGPDRAAAEQLFVHQWFSSSKRGPLSNLVVGTVDQALFGSLRSRHVMLRHLALAGKVVIIDEVHAYSSFMNVYLDRLLHWLAAYDVPVILLSATLPAERRKDLVVAYDSGRLSDELEELSYSERKAFAARHDVLDGDIGYPSIVVSGGREAPEVLTSTATGEERVVSIECLDDSLDSLARFLRQGLRDGGCAVVIRNTVGRVQETARFLRAAFSGIEVLVAHARFLAADRRDKDIKLLDLFGSPQRSKGRPKQYIVVASQVVEQSLDIDFDLMVSDLAPIDLLLQRAGRLHRHLRDEGQSARPAPLRAATLAITGVDWGSSPPEPDRSYQKIYHLHTLYRTLSVLQDRQSIRLPADIPALVQSVYGGAPLGPAEWADPMTSAARSYVELTRQKRREAAGFRLNEVMQGSSLIGWVHAQADDPETSERKGQASVRDGDETLEVLVLQRAGDGTLRTPGWLTLNGGVEIPLDQPPPFWLAKTILGCAIRLPGWMCRGQFDTLIAALERDFEFPAFHASRDLRGELVLVVDEHGDVGLHHYRLHYNPDTGLEVVRNE